MGEYPWTPDADLQHLPGFERLQAEVAAATAPVNAQAILELGTDAGEPMFEAARAALARYSVTLRVSRLEAPLPRGPFDVAVAALAVHRLDASATASLFVRVAASLRPGGRFVLADEGFDRPDALDDWLRWLTAAGYDARPTWVEDDLAVIVADLP